MDYITSNVETIISYDLEAETYELKFTSRLCIDDAKRIGNSILKVISRIGNRETEYQTEIDLNPCLVSGNILYDLHLRQDTFAASFKNNIQRLMSESSVYSPPYPPSPISESIRKHLLNMERLTGLNCKEWLRNWRRVLVIAGKSHLTEYPIPVPPEQVIIKSTYDERNFLVDESEKIRDLMLLTIDPEFRKDFESLGPYELMQLVEEKFQKPVEDERARIFKRLAECKLKEGSSIDSHVLQIEAYIGELHSSNGSATFGLSPVKRHSKKRSRSFGHVLNWESTKSDTVIERLEDAPRESVGYGTLAHRSTIGLDFRLMQF
ncbi:hypothetical protein L2E82_36274 [Cichorium intybus]|uniref:Uncharacterized protein n=1 Tax=Cichorium intybus TaxID=13427 RepID=A0ACB9BRG3_CICIN|nr:hypothetical protein L2E82_36274 [Cichorium intybus]